MTEERRERIEELTRLNAWKLRAPGIAAEIASRLNLPSELIRPVPPSAADAIWVKVVEPLWDDQPERMKAGEVDHSVTILTATTIDRIQAVKMLSKCLDPDDVAKEDAELFLDGRTNCFHVPSHSVLQQGIELLREDGADFIACLDTVVLSCELEVRGSYEVYSMVVKWPTS